MTQGSILYIDRNMLVNLWASGHAMEILQAQPYRCAILSEPGVAPLLLWSADKGEDEPLVREEVSISSLVLSGLLEEHHLERTQHASVYIQFAHHIADKQAALLTLVALHESLLATDDRRTRKIFRRFFPDAALMSTLTLFYIWQEHDHVDGIELQSIARLVEQRAQFFPPEDDPLLPWWRHIVS